MAHKWARIVYKNGINNYCKRKVESEVPIIAFLKNASIYAVCF
jgi:hypothetical protein